MWNIKSPPFRNSITKKRCSCFGAQKKALAWDSLLVKTSSRTDKCLIISRSLSFMRDFIPQWGTNAMGYCGNIQWTMLCFWISWRIATMWLCSNCIHLYKRHAVIHHSCTTCYHFKNYTLMLIFCYYTIRKYSLIWSFPEDRIYYMPKHIGIFYIKLFTVWPPFSRSTVCS